MRELSGDSQNGEIQSYLTLVLDKDGEMVPSVEPVKVPGDHTDYTKGYPDEFRRLIL